MRRISDEIEVTHRQPHQNVEPERPVFDVVLHAAIGGGVVRNRACTILRDRSDAGVFVGQLQDGIEQERGESVVARDPATAPVRCGRFQFSAALVNSQHRDMVGKLTMPAMLDEPADGHQAVIAQLKVLLAATRPNEAVWTLRDPLAQATTRVMACARKVFVVTRRGCSPRESELA
jgi:hypothetical protein